MIRSSRLTLMALGFASLCMIQRLLIVDGHLRRHHYNNNNLHHHGDHHHDHHHHGHRHLDGGYMLDPDIFDGCMVLCYGDIVYRYGVQFAERLLAEGFTFEECPEDRNSTTVNRSLGASNQPERQWNIPELRGADGKLHIPYIVQSHPTFDQWDTYATIAAAMEHIEKKTGVIKFVPRTKETNYIFYVWDDLTNGNSCAANVGRQSTSSKVFLGWCVKPMHKGNIIHETLHALGFWHEHSRPDRDDYITFHAENLLSSSYEVNFEKSFRINSLGSPYDISSIMHYPANAMSINPYDSAFDTLVPKNPLLPGEVMGQRVGLSEQDIEQLRLLYQCSTGVRSGEISINELCSTECKCWEYAGECLDDDECMGDLVCADTPDSFSSLQESVADSLPPAEITVDTSTINCDHFCHRECCQFPNNAAQCPLTCSSQSSRRLSVTPSRMCLSTTTTTTTQATATTATSTTTTTTQATATTRNNSPWYIDWSISKCVQSCDGPPPCGGVGQWVLFHSSMEICCDNHLSWMDSVKRKTYEGCHIIPDSSAPPVTKVPTTSPTTRPPTKKPTQNPTNPSTSSSPTKSPTKKPTGSPTKSPTAKPSVTLMNTSPTGSPTTPIPTMSPTPNPTKTNPPTSPPTTGPPSKSPTLNPTKKPTTGAPSKQPTPKPTPSPTDDNITMYSGTFYIDWVVDDGRCVQDCDGPRPCGGKKDAWETGFPTESACCSTMSYKPYSQCTYKPSTTPNTTSAGTPTTQPTNQPTAPLDIRWYPGEVSECKNDGRAPSWQNNKYTSQATCCTSHFSWAYNTCMGIKDTGSQRWYIEWGMSKCVQDCEKSMGGSCGGLKPGSWILTHSSASACCTAHMSYASLEQCKYNPVT